MENEVFFAFGQGLAYSDQAAFLREEIAVIRAHDTLGRPIIVTESGDKGSWEDTAAFGDILGVSFYGISYENGAYGVHDNGNPEDWNARAQALRKIVFLTELQAEPWGPVSNKDLAYAETLKSMSPVRLKEYLEFVTRAGFTDVILWGAEWWLWMRDGGHPEMLQTIAPLAARP